MKARAERDYVDAKKQLDRRLGALRLEAPRAVVDDVVGQVSTTLVAAYRLGQQDAAGLRP